MFSACIKASAEKACGKSWPIIIDRISTPGASFLPITCTTLPSALRFFSGHCVISTSTFILCLAPLNCSFGIKISLPNRLSSGITKPKWRLLSKVPTTCCTLRCKIRITSPSARDLAVASRFIRTMTLSPFIAPFSSEAGIKMSSTSGSSCTKKPNPFG